MLQRQQTELRYRHNLQKKLEQTQQQLSSDFYQLTQLKEQIRKNRINQVQCSNILQQMLQKMSYPIIGVQILRDKFQEMNLFQSTGFSSFEIIQSKAQAIYIQSIMGDLKRMQNDQPFEAFQQSSVKNIIDEINWKIGMEKSIHQSRVEEVGEHVDLMKFFEGVRNYQNWNENVKKQTLDKLKHKASNIQLKLTLKKGFILSKFEKITHTFEQNHKKLFLDKCYFVSKMHNLQKFTKVAQKSKLKQSFDIIYQESQLLKDSQKVGILFENYWTTKVGSVIQKQVLKFLKTSYKMKLFMSKMQKVFNQKQKLAYSKLLQKINYKKKTYASSALLGLQKLKIFTQRKQKSIGLKILNIPHLHFLKVLNKCIVYVLRDALKQIKSQSDSNKVTKTQMSLKMKGKVLDSLPTPQQRPVDIREAFLNWYIKGNQNKLSKKIYNIWLTGNTSKFTFFMRMKNLINQNRNYKIKYELKLFLMVFNEKMNKYYNHGQKSILQKWITNSRRIKKIQKMFNTLLNVDKQTNQVLIKDGWQKILNVFKGSLAKQKFCLKYMSNFVANIKTSVNSWKILPDVKRSKGQIVMRKIMRNVIDQIIQTQKTSFNIFKSNKTQGHDKKVKVLRKAFNLDFIYLQKYYQLWRIKKNDLIKKDNDFESKKGNMILLMQKYHEVQYQKNLKDILKKFQKKKNQQKIRQTKTKKVFTHLLKKNQTESLLNVYMIFKRNWQEGVTKKNNLVKWLVQANKTKQSLTLNLIKHKSLQMHNLEKIRRTEQLFVVAESKLRQSITIFDKSQFIFTFLNKILTNRGKNFHLAFKNIQALPNRINWKKRNNGIKLYETLMHFYKRNKNYSLSRYKENLLTGRFKMTKSMDIMAAKYFDVTRKYFNTYRKNVNRIKMNELNKNLGGSFEMMDEASKNNFRLFFLGEAVWKKKADHINKLNQRVKGRISQTLKLWRETSQSMAYYEKLLNEKKTRYIQILTKSLGKSQTSEAKRAIGLFRKNRKVTDVQLTFLKRLCDSQAGKVIKGMMIWKNLPEPKNKEKISRATKFEALMSKIATRNFKKTFSIFKQQQYGGNQKKKYCIRQLVAKSCSGMKSYFEKWRQNNKLSIIFGRCEAISHLIHINQNIAQNNFRLLFEGKEASVKREKLHGLQLILCRQKKELISLWRQKMIYMRNFDNKKAELLIKLSEIKKSTQNKNVRDYVVKKFTQLRVKQIMDKEKRKQHKLLQILDNSMRRRKINISESFDVFRFNLYKGNFKKKKSFENWLRDKIAHINGILGGWNNLSREAVLADKRTSISHNFEEMDSIVRANLAHLVANRKQMQIKRKTLNNLFRAQQLRLKGTINMWLSNVKELKILGELDKQAKSSILERINKIVNIGSEQNVKRAIQKFHNSMKIQSIQKKFINQLLKSKSGLILGALGKWKSIPVINLGDRYKKGQKFFNKLQALQRTRRLTIYQEFKKDYEEATRVKKQSILQLFDMTSTGIRRFYRRWQKSTKQRLTLKSVQELMKSMQIMDGALTNQFQIVFQDQRAYTIKVNAINRLIAASQGTVCNFFNVWRGNVKQMKIEQSMDNEKKTLALAMFTKALDGSEKNMVIDSIRKFRMNLTVTEISKKFFNRLLQTKTGKLFYFMQKFKSIPDAKIAVRKKKAIKFESFLNKFAMKVIRTAFNPFKSCNYIAIDRKKYCINKLVRKSMGQQFKSFTRWRNVNQQGKVLEHSYYAQKCFSNMQTLVFDTMMPMFINSKEEVQKKKNLCRKLVMNSQFVQHHAFMIWKQAQREDDLKIVKRQSKVKDALSGFINVFSSHEKKNAISGFAPFRNFLVLNKLEKFSEIKNRTHTKAYKFYDIIQKFKNTRLSLLIQGCRNSAIEMNFANKISSLETMFKNSNEVYGENLMMLMRNERESVIIENALNRIFANFKVGTQKAFSIWRQNARVLKLENMMGNQKKKTILDIMNKFILNSEFTNIKRSIELFQKNSKQTKIQKQILMKIINCKAGCVPVLFMKWKALPSQTGKKYKLKAMKFETALFRAWNLRMKTSYQSFKTQSYDATVKKQYAIRKLISVTMSDSNRVFNKWRKVNNETKITQKMINMDQVFSFSQGIFLKNIQIFNEYKNENTGKFNALNQIFLVQQNYLKESLKKWTQENKNYKIQMITHALKKYTDEQMNKRFIKESFNQLKQRFEVQTMKGYINSLWRWKLTNTEAQYYEKFIKIFSQSQQLLILSKLLNKKEGDSLHFAMTQIKLSANQRFNRKVQLVEKYMSKKVKVYFQRMRANIYRQQVSTWKGKYGQVVKTQKLTNIISKINRKEQNEAFSILKKNEFYLQKVEKLTTKIENYRLKNIEAGFKNIYREGFYKIIKIALDIRNKVKEHMCLESFSSIMETSKQRFFNTKLQNVTKATMTRRAFQYLKKNSDRLAKQKLSVLLIAEKLGRKIHEDRVKTIQSFQKRRIKCICLNKISQTINKKVQDLQRTFFRIDQNDVKIVQLLQLFKRGTAIKSVIQKQDKKLLKSYFDKMKKKENKWIGESIKKFATRSSIRSSVAVSLWRLKMYAQN